MNGGERPEGFDAWYATNVYKQRQPGYVAATVTLPLGDASADQLRALADIARRFVKDTIRTTVEQNILFRWVSEADLPEFYRAIKAIGLGGAGRGNYCGRHGLPRDGYLQTGNCVVPRSRAGTALPIG